MRRPYRGCLIDPQSYQSDEGRWRAHAVVQAVVVSKEGRRAVTQPVSGPSVETFDTEAEANERAVTLAKQWIDANVKPEPPQR